MNTSLFATWWKRSLAGYSLVLAGTVLVGAALLLRYLHFQGMETIFPYLFDQTTLFLLMAVMVGFLLVLIAFFFAWPLTFLASVEEDDSRPISRLDRLLCFMGLLEWARTCFTTQPTPPRRSPALMSVIASLALLLAWWLPAFVAETRGGFDGVVILAGLAAFVLAVWLLGCLFSPARLWQGFWRAALFLATGLLTSWMAALALVAGLTQDARPGIGELTAVALVALFYAVILTTVIDQRRKGVSATSLSFKVGTVFLLFFAVLLPEQILIAAGRFAGLESGHQQVLLPCPLPGESTEVSTIAAKPVTKTKAKQATQPSTPLPEQAWVGFATVFHFGAVDVLCNPDAERPGWIIPQTCLLLRDGRPVTRFARQMEKEAK